MFISEVRGASYDLPSIPSRRGEAVRISLFVQYLKTLFIYPYTVYQILFRTVTQKSQIVNCQL